jgi:hypothetical protein
MRVEVLLGALLFTTSAHAQSLTWGLAGGSENWPTGMRDTVSDSMDEAVALYNRYGVFEKRVTANYNAGVTTAQGNYDGWIDFGGSRNTRVALHELAHTLGVGTYRPFNGGSWDEKGAAGKLLKLFDGQRAVLSTGGTHFWPYGLNYDDEDGAVARERHVKLLSALRFDMGIVSDSDRDGLPDDWERFHFEGLTQGASGDPDGDAITNLDEYGSDADPNVACPVRDGHTFVVRTQVSERALTLANDVQVKQYVGNRVQKWIARYAGGGFWRFENGGKVLQLEGTDTASGRPLTLGTQTDALSQQWRIVGGIGARANYWQLANRETGKLADCLVDGKEDAAVQQWPYGGNIPQQYWSFEELGAAEPDAGVRLDAGMDVSVADAGAPRDASVRDASVDASRSFEDAGAAPSPSDDVEEPENDGGCALASRSDASVLLLALALLLRRRTPRAA